MPKKILFTAQARGFGPSAKAFHLANGISEFSITFIGESVAYEFAQLNSGPYERCINSEEISNSELHKLISEFDLIISVMNQDIALLCYELGRPYLFFDSLFGFWKTYSDETLFSEFATLLATNDLTHERLHSYSSHERKLLAHFLSTGSYIQNFWGVGERFQRLQNHLGRSVLVSPFVTQYIQHKLSSQRLVSDLLLINIGGVKGRDATKEDFSYASFIEKFASRIIQDDSFPFKRILICSGLKTRHRVLTFPSGRVIEHDSFPSAVFLNMMQEAAVVMSSPGLTSILESIFMKKPVIFLPEQHGSQTYNMSRLKQSPFAKFAISISDVKLHEFDASEMNAGEEAFFDNLTDRIFDGLHSLLRAKIREYIDEPPEYDFEKIMRSFRENTVSMKEVGNRIRACI